MPNGNLNPDSRHLKTQLTSLKNNGWNPTMEVWFKWFSFIYWVIIRFQPLIFRGVINNRMPYAHVTPLEVSKTLEKKTWRHVVCNTRVYPPEEQIDLSYRLKKRRAGIGDRLLPRKVIEETFGPQNHEKWRFYTPKIGYNPQKWRFWVPMERSTKRNPTFSGQCLRPRPWHIIRITPRHHITGHIIIFKHLFFLTKYFNVISMLNSVNHNPSPILVP